MSADSPLSFTALLLYRFKKHYDWFIEVVEEWLASKTSCLATFVRRLLVKSREVPISSVMSVRPSVCPPASVLLPLDRFLWNLILGTIKKKSSEKTKILLKSNTNMGHLTWRCKYFYIVGNFPHTSRPTLGSTQPPTQWVSGHSRRWSGLGVTLNTHPI